MFRRRRPISQPVTIRLDGRELPAAVGEPIAAALIGSDQVTLARSTKLHRPRGPACMRGGCEGCVARVDGEPNVLTCLVPTCGGEQIETQNVLGTRQTDLLRVTDWFFPRGIDHHHLLAGVPALGDVMTGVARKLAGIGTLPDESQEPTPAEVVDTDVAVVGGGLAGMSAAGSLAEHGLRVTLIDDGLELGGACLGLRDVLDEAKRTLTTPASWAGGVDAHARTTAIGVFGRELVAAGPKGGMVIRPRAFVFASGAHDGVLGVPNNDLPGVMSARALCRLAAHDVVPDGPVAIVGDDAFARHLEAALTDVTTVRLEEADVDHIDGSSSVRGITRKDGSRVSAVVVAAAVEGAPAFELALQAGAEVKITPSGGYAVVVDGPGRAGERLWAVGECTGARFEAEELLAAGRAVAADVASALDDGLEQT